LIARFFRALVAGPLVALGMLVFGFGFG